MLLTTPSAVAPLRTKRGVVGLLSLMIASRWIVYGFTDIALISILREAGATLGQLSLMYATGLLLLLKFLWSPFVDKVTFGRYHYKAWFIGAQFVCLVSLSFLLLVDPKLDFYLLLLLLIIGSIAASFRDIATDALAVKLLSEEQRASASGWMSAGCLAGVVVGGGVILLYYETIGWAGAVLVLAIGTFLPLPFVLTLQESPPAPPPPTVGPMSMLAQFFREPGYKSWALILLLASIAGIIGASLLPILLIDLNWPLAKVGLVSNIIAPLIALAASALAGYVFARISRKKAMSSSLVLVFISGLALVPLPLGWYNEWAEYLVVVASIVTGTILTIALKTPMLDKSASVPTHSATFYSIQSSIVVFASLGGGSIGTLMADFIGFPATLTISCILGVFGFFAVSRYRNW